MQLAASSVASGRPMGVLRSSAVARVPRVQRTQRRVVVVRAADDDAELEARLAKLKAAKGETTDKEKREARAARQGSFKAAAGPKKPEYDFTGETVYWEGGPANGDLIFNMVLGTTLVWLPLTFAAVGRTIFLKYKFTDRRLSVADSFPAYNKQTDVAYQEVAEVRTVPRGLGAWGDMVVVLRNGDKVELRALERFQELKDYILARREALTGRKASDKGIKGSVMDLDADDAAVGLGGGKGKGFSS